MKVKQLTLIVFILFWVFNIKILKGQGCNGVPIFYESFNNGIPSNFTMFSNDTNTVKPSWAVQGYTGMWQEGTRLNEKCILVCGRGNNSVSNEDYFFTPPITLPAGTSCFSWKSSSASVDYSSWPDVYNIIIMLSPPTQSNVSSSTILYSSSGQNSFYFSEHNIDLSSYANQTVYIGFYYFGFYLENIDNIKVTSPVNNDLGLTKYNGNNIVFPSDTNFLNITVKNGGLTPINNFDVCYTVDNSIEYCSNFNMVLNPDSELNIIHPAGISFNLMGRHKLRMYTKLPNGQLDLNHSNDTIEVNYYISDKQKKLLIEEFTQASCGPCANVNPYADSIISTNKINNKVNALKYHTNWPGIDPIYSDNPTQSDEQTSYYGVTYVPHLIIDGQLMNGTGVYFGSPLSMNQNKIDSIYNNQSAIYELTIEATTGLNTIDAKVKVKSILDANISNMTLKIVLVEDSVFYTTPPGSNGEVDFYDVMRSFANGTSGLLVGTMSQNQELNFTGSIPYNNTYDLNHIHVLAYLQDEATQRIYQSEIIKPNGFSSLRENKNDKFSLFPNPTNNILNINISDNKKDYAISIYNSTGSLVLIQNFKSQIDVSGLAPGLYLLQLKDKKGNVGSRLFSGEQSFRQTIFQV